jgi:hypothetical protein
MRIFAILLALTLPAFAQQQLSPSQMAIIIDGNVNVLAQLADQQEKTIQQLQARIKELEDKYESRKPK